MISYFGKRANHDGFESTQRPHEYTTWVHGNSVSKEELSGLADTFHLDANILRDVCDINELPRVEYTETGTYLFLRAPRLSGRGEVHTSPLLTIVSGSRFFTLAHGSELSAETIKQGIMPLEGTASPPIRYSVAVIATVVGEYEELVHRTSKAVKDVSHRLRSHEVTNKDFIHFVTIEDNLNECKTNLGGMRAIAYHLIENRRKTLAKPELELVDDIQQHIQQLLVTVESLQQSVASIRNAYSTIANNTLNQRMKTLTVFTVLIALPNVFYGMYGMNVALPFADEPWAYVAIVAFTIALIISIYILARKTKLF